MLCVSIMFSATVEFVMDDTVWHSLGEEKMLSISTGGGGRGWGV